MVKKKWNRQVKRSVENDLEPPKQLSMNEYTVKRVRPARKKKTVHPGYTIISAHRLWIFEKNKSNRS